MYYSESQKDDSEIEEKLLWYAECYPARGFSEYFKRIRKDDFTRNHKRFRHVHLKLGLNHRKKAKRRITKSEKQVLLHPLQANMS